MTVADKRDQPWLEASNLVVKRAERVLLHKLSFRLFPGTILHLRGANGSGKTSLLRVLAGLSPHGYTGELNFNGMPLQSQRYELAAALLYIGHAPGIKSSLSAKENLRWYERLSIEKPHLQAEDALAAVGLDTRIDIPCRYLSAGQQRRVALARLFQSRQGLWILDEPFTALDQAGIEALQERIMDHASSGGAIVLTSHQSLGSSVGAAELDLEQCAAPGIFA